MGMKTTASKQISGAAYVAVKAVDAAKEGAVSARLAHLFFQCAVVDGRRTIEDWDRLVVRAMKAEATVQDVLEYGEEGEEGEDEV